MGLVFASKFAVGLTSHAQGQSLHPTGLPVSCDLSLPRPQVLVSAVELAQVRFAFPMTEFVVVTPERAHSAVTTPSPHKISLTRFGFVICSGGETPEDRVFAYPVGGTAADLVGLAMPPEQDFAFVYGSGRQTAVVFSSGRVEFSDSDGCCGSPPTFERLEPQLVRISLGIICGFVRITIDTEQEKIVGTDVISDPNFTCF